MNRRQFIAGNLALAALPAVGVTSQQPDARLIVTRAHGPTVVDIGRKNCRAITIRAVNDPAVICIYDSFRDGLIDVYAFSAAGDQVSVTVSLRVLA